MEEVTKGLLSWTEGALPPGGCIGICHAQPGDLGTGLSQDGRGSHKTGGEATCFFINEILFVTNSHFEIRVSWMGNRLLVGSASKPSS